MSTVNRRVSVTRELDWSHLDSTAGQQHVIRTSGIGMTRRILTQDLVFFLVCRCCDTKKKKKKEDAVTLLISLDYSGVEAQYGNQSQVSDRHLLERHYRYNMTRYILNNDVGEHFSGCGNNLSV